MNDKNKILLEAGTNEFELMEFLINGITYGINIAKIKEIIVATDVEPLPNSNEYIEGIFKHRDTIVPVLDLPSYLNLDNTKHDRDIFIVTYFNNTNIAFRVNSIEGIKRVFWSDIKRNSDSVYSNENNISTGVLIFDQKIVTLLDFEKILSDVSPSTRIDINSVSSSSEDIKNRDNINILIAEDSLVLSESINNCLKKAGFKNIHLCFDGQEAYDYINNFEKDKVLENISIIITDIEMPRMDGHRLVKFIKEDEVLKNIPVIIFSSLINDSMYIKGKELGADEQITKPEILNLVNSIDFLVDKYNKKRSNL